MAPTYIVLMGVQGAGKGTQAEILTKQRNLPHITTGGMFRSLPPENPLAAEVAAIMKRGDLVPDTITIQVVKDRLSRPDAKQGAIFDGFPRTLTQAEALDKLLAEMGSKVAIVPFFNLERSVALRRLTSRWQCSNNDQHIYNMLEKKPKAEGVCDICGGKLVQRADDTPEAVEKRINAFYQQTMPLIEYYRSHGVLVEIDGDQPIEAVTKAVNSTLDKVVK